MSQYDEISNRIIKLSSPFIISPLTHICNAILNTGIFPDRFKFAIVKHITTQINYDQINLTNVTETKFLGLIIDDTLSRKEHTDYVSAPHCDVTRDTAVDSDNRQQASV
jgi:hypothetical protein